MIAIGLHNHLIHVSAHGGARLRVRAHEWARTLLVQRRRYRELLTSYGKFTGLQQPKTFDR